MNLSKSYEFLNPDEIDERINVIGCGSVGSTVVELLARFGLKRFGLWDFDSVEPKNIVNQMFTSDYIGQPKVDSLLSMISDINPDILTETDLHREGWNGQNLSGYVFLCVDSIELRRMIVEKNRYNPNIKAMFDFRTRLTDAQHYAADWSDEKQISNFFASMQFSHVEAAHETPVSACGTVLGVAPTVRMIATVGVTNFVNFVREGKLKQTILADPFAFQLDAF